MSETVCPRCGHRNSFSKGFLPGTCACKVCLSQLDWKEIGGAGPDCRALADEQGSGVDESRGEGREAEKGAEYDA